MSEQNFSKLHDVPTPNLWPEIHRRIREQKRREARPSRASRAAVVVFSLVLAGAAVTTVIVAFFGNGRPPAGRGTASLGSITALKNAVPEGRLVLQLNSGLEVLPSGATHSVSLGGGPVAPYGVSPDGTEIIATTYVREPTNYTRDGQLLTIDTATGERRVLVRASPKQDLGPAVWSPDGLKVAYRLTVLPVDPAKRFPHGTTEQTVCIAEVANEAVMCFPNLRTVDDFAWSPDGGEIVVDGVGPNVPLRLLDLQTGQVSEFVSPHDAGLEAALGGHARVTFVLVGWSFSGSYVSTDVGAPAIFDREGRFVMLGHPSQEFSEVASWSPTNNVLAYAIGRPPYEITDLYLLDPSTNQDRLFYSTGRGDHAAIIGDVAWSPSGRWLAASVGQSVRIIDVTGRASTQVVHLGPQDTADPLVGWGP